MDTFGGAVVCFVIDVMKPLLSPRLALVHRAPSKVLSLLV